MLNFGTPNRKRPRRFQQPVMLYRSIKPEMKNLVTTLAYGPAINLTLGLNVVSQGAATFERIGSKIKIWRIDYMIENVNNSNAVRVTLQIPNIVGAASTQNFASSVDRESFTLLKDTIYHSGTAQSPRGILQSHQLPVGVVSKYAGVAGTTINHNQIQARITTSGTETLSGYFRIWYTDV